MQEDVKKMRYEFASYISVYTKPKSLSDDNNLQSSCNDEPIFDCQIAKLSISRDIYFRIACQLDPIKKFLGWK